ncbi:MAG: hypothetical protein HYY44_08405 [Deltaproteobacteria bacterium]|nr:hypothetical protein [Deltaproteobacteria bacterium]MBI4196936.1 hypothetical protein [Deltaproteobacteria bacterium]
MLPFFLILFLLSLSSPVLAMDVGPERDYEQSIQEVFQTQLVYPQEAGEFQFILQPGFFEGSGRDLLLVPLKTEFGLTDHWQLGLGWIAFQDRRPTAGSETWGIGDIEIDTKYSIMNLSASDFHMAIGGAIEFPIANIHRDLTDGFIEYTPRLLMAYDLVSLDRSQIFWEGNVNLVQRILKHRNPANDVPGAHQMNINTGFFIPFSEMRFVSEIRWSYDRWNNNGLENSVYYTPGLVWDPPSSLEIGVGAPLGLTPDADNFRIMGLLLFELGGTEL